MNLSLPLWLRMTQAVVGYSFTFSFLVAYAIAGVLDDMWGYVVGVLLLEALRNYCATGAIRPGRVFRLRTPVLADVRVDAPMFPRPVKILLWCLGLYLIPLSFGFPGQQVLDAIGPIEMWLTAPLLNTQYARQALEAAGQGGLFPHYRHAYTVWCYGFMAAHAWLVIYTFRRYHAGDSMFWERYTPQQIAMQNKATPGKIMAAAGVFHPWMIFGIFFVGPDVDPDYERHAIELSSGLISLYGLLAVMYIIVIQSFVFSGLMTFYERFGRSPWPSAEAASPTADCEGTGQDSQSSSGS